MAHAMVATCCILLLLPAYSWAGGHLGEGFSRGLEAVRQEEPAAAVPKPSATVPESELASTRMIDSDRSTRGLYPMAPPAPDKKKHPLPKLSDFKWYHAIGILCASLGLLLAAGGGIGGGGILVPIYILVMNFSPRYGIPLSNVTILGGSIANNAFNILKRHPARPRPMIDYDLVLLMEPPTIAGAVLGSILNKVLPEWVITTLLVLVLGFTACRTWSSGNKLWQKEEDKLGLKAENEEDDQTVAAPLIATATKDAQGGGDGDADPVSPSSADILAEIEEDEAIQFPWWKVSAIALCFGLVVISNLLKLHTAKCGSTGYWILMLCPVFITGAMMIVVRMYLLNKMERKKQAGYVLVEGDIEWDATRTIAYPLLCALSGVFAGMFGIGGGIVKGPLMVEMGVLPEVSAATAAFMIAFTASSATVTYASFGNVAWDFAGVLVVLGLVFTSIGQYIVNGYVARTGRSSVIVFIIATIVGVSTLLMGYESGLLAYHDIEHDKAGWGSLCSQQ